MAGDSDPHGLDWLDVEPQALVMRVKREGEPERPPRVFDPEILQRVMDKASRDFFDPSRPVTPPVPDPPSPSASPPSFRSRRRF